MKLLEGVVIGVSAGIILSLFFWARDFVKRRIERRDQIRYLASLIANFRELIYSAETIHISAISQTLTRDQIRKAHYDDMRRQLDSVLQGRSSCLSFDEINEVKLVFFTDLYPTVRLNDKAYEGIFGKLESIKWLKLPPRTT